MKKQNMAKKSTSIKADQKIFAPEIDGLIESCKTCPEISDKKLISILKNIFNLMLQIKEMGDDEYRSIWITEQRGGIRSFGSYKEYHDAGEVESRHDFEELWLSFYPEKEKWYEFAVARYENVGYYYIDSNLVFQFPFGTAENKDAYPIQNKLAGWLLEKVTQTVKSIKDNPVAYNQNIKDNLPFRRRLGKIQRKDFWKIFSDEKKHFKKGISPEMIEIINKVRAIPNEGPKNLLSSMTAGDFFRYCEMGYDANDYFRKSTKPLTARDKYRLMADGRDCGLMQVNLTSVRAFAHWYSKESHCGGHPWEICRGGNSTHISLFIHKNNDGWYLRLAGSSCMRVVETVRFAAALYTNNIPFILSDAEEIYRMIRGVDYIGVVPETVFPRYCHSLFNEKERIIDFMNLGFEKTDELIKLTKWYPIREILPENGVGKSIY